MERRKPLGRSLVDKGLITEDQLRTALEEQKKTGLYLRQVLLKLGMVKEEHILKFFEEDMGIPTLDLSRYSIEPEIVRLIPEKLARRYKLIPVFVIGDTLTVAMADPLDVVAIDEIKAATGREVEAVMSGETQIVEAVDRHFPFGGSLEDFGTSESAEIEVAKAEIAENLDAPAVKLVRAVIQQAARERASDIHVEPEERKLRVRFRVDGMLREVSTHPFSLHPAVVSRIKVMAELDIAEKRLPQDGRCKIVLEGKELDLRVSTFPTVNGENVVIRILDRSIALLDLSQIGLDAVQLKIMEDAIEKPNGIVLVTGPTGSGKTTTLYACLNKINSVERNIVTLEDPVEYQLSLIRQTQVDSEIGLTFAAGLRSLLRQDPDVIMVGEIRDGETAEIAIRSSLTGHLVLSTVHTNNAVGAIARLMDMGAEPFLISSSLLVVAAQRLLRAICENCKQPEEVPEAVLARIGIAGTAPTFFRGVGCRACGSTGFKGRTGIFEVLVVDDEVRRLISRGVSTEEISDAGRNSGMKTLRQAAVEKALAGITTLKEALRLTQKDSDTPNPDARETETPEWQFTHTGQER
ncbi:MAG: ATPase, T2SS/T4P/T4SS family [Candidatus Eisenbacteria bacterium]